MEDSEMEKLQETITDPVELEAERMERGLVASSGKMVRSPTHPPTHPPIRLSYPSISLLIHPPTHPPTHPLSNRC